MPDFFRTMMGRKFYEVDVVSIKNSLSKLNDELSVANELKERELKVLTRLVLAKEKANELKEKEKEKELNLLKQ